MTGEAASCVKCGTVKLVNEFDWRKGRPTPSKVCKVCKRAYMQDYHRQRVQQGADYTPKTPFVEGGKRCSACKEIKPLDSFDKYSDTGKAIGKCLSCQRVYGKEKAAEYRERHPDRARKSGIDFYYRNRATCLQNNKVYRELNKKVPPPTSLTCKHCKAEKPVKEFQRENAMGMRFTLICNACFDPRAGNRLGKARRRAAPGTFTSRDLRLKEELQGGRCYYCKQPIGQDRHIEHKIPVCRGGTNWPANIALACPTCNLRKKDKNPREFRKYLERKAART